jgi:hypothetical protein
MFFLYKKERLKSPLRIEGLFTAIILLAAYRNQYSNFSRIMQSLGVGTWVELRNPSTNAAKKHDFFIREDQ